MADCSSIDPLVTAYVDDQLVEVEREQVERHLRACPPCYQRVVAERAVHQTIRDRAPGLVSERAPESLRERCAQLAEKTGRESPSRPDALNKTGTSRVPTTSRWRSRLAPLALAASLVTVVGGAFVYRATEQSSLVMAAELAADHIKCFGLNALLGTHHEPAAVESSMLSRFGWRVQLPAEPSAGFDLVGSRLCLYGEGRMAHLMYRHEGQAVSVFMLPKVARPDEVVEVLGHEAVVWSGNDRTFVLVSRGTRAQAVQMASMIQVTLR